MNVETYNLNILEGTSNKIDKISYNLDLLEVLWNIFQFFTIIKIKLFIDVLLAVIAVVAELAHFYLIA